MNYPFVNEISEQSNTTLKLTEMVMIKIKLLAFEQFSATNTTILEIGTMFERIVEIVK